MDISPSSVPLVDAAIKIALSVHEPAELTGVSCIAVGADSIFASAVLAMGGSLEVVIPSEDYRERRVSPNHAQLFDELVRRAASVRIMPYAQANRDAYEAANNAIIAAVNQMIAVWDGLSAADKGGTAAVVQSAHRRGVPVEVIWPSGAART